MPGVLIREAKRIDRRPIAEFTAKTWRWGDYVMAAWSRWMKDPSGKLLVAELQGKPVGLMFMRLREGGEAYLGGARVNPEYRRMGVATALTEKCIDHARQAGAKFSRLVTSSKNIPATSLAEKMGFEQKRDLAMVSASPRKKGEVARIRRLSLRDAHGAVDYIRKNCGERPVKFVWWDYSSLLPEDVEKYCEEGFAAAQGEINGIAFYQPFTNGEMFLMLDFAHGSSDSLKELGLFLRLEASSLGCRSIFGVVDRDKMLVRGLRRAGYRIRKSGMRVYEMDLTGG